MSEQRGLRGNSCTPRKIVEDCGIDLPWLRNQIVKCFDLSELKQLCFDLQCIDFEDLEGITKKAKAQALVSYFARRGILEHLIQVCKLNRPIIDWRIDTDFALQEKSLHMLMDIIMSKDFSCISVN